MSGQKPPSAPVARIPLNEALARLEAAAGDRFLSLFKHGSLAVEIYAPRGTDPQTPHTRDEIYVVASGRGLFFDGTSHSPVEPGTFLFVEAGRPHRFEEFTENFSVWVFFYGPEGGEE